MNRCSSTYSSRTIRGRLSSRRARASRTAAGATGYLCPVVGTFTPWAVSR
jgi:hypothetical protein